MSKNIDWSNLGFGYIQTEHRFVSNYKNGAWDDGAIIEDDMITMSECACVLQYAQTIFEGLKAYTTEKGNIVIFRPDLNAERLANSSRRMEMPVFPEDKFIDAVVQTVKANKRSFVGLVTSDKMDKTIVVTVATKKMDRLYKKYVTRSKKYMAHDEANDAHVGDTVRIVECRPLSKNKCWRLAEIVERAK